MDRYRFMVKFRGEWTQATKNGYPVLCALDQLATDSPVEKVDSTDSRFFFYVDLDSMLKG